VNQKKIIMIKRSIIIPALILFCLSAMAQIDKEGVGPKREVTLYNPYKPSLSIVQKRNFLPELKDTIKVRRDFSYEINTKPFQPEYQISPIKAAALLPDPLPKLYKSYIKLGMGNYTSPLGEISITNERSKKGAIGLYARHFSNNGNIKLDNDRKVYAGYMDNDASLFGKKFFRENVLEGSVDFIQRTRYAYGYDTSILVYAPSNKDIRLGYNNIGGQASFSSLKLDSADFMYDFDFFYNYFTGPDNLSHRNMKITGIMAKSFNKLYAGAGIGYDRYVIPDFLSPNSKYYITLNPFVKKSSDLWSFKLGLQAVLERNMDPDAVLHVYPDLYFGFDIVPSFIGFFTSLTGRLEKNDPLEVIKENPFLYPDGSLFTLPNTDHEIIVSAGIKGQTGLKGSYLISASYSIINDMLFYSNLVYTDSIPMRGSSIPLPGSGNYFSAISDDVELLNLHGELTQQINDKLSLNGAVNFYRYTLSNDYAWNKPDFDAKLGLKYNLRDKIIAGIEVTAIGKRNVVVNAEDTNEMVTDFPIGEPQDIIDMPAHVNLNISAEYRYSKILSLWAKINNVAYNKYYEWAYYPSKRFFFMLGFTYNL